jgi:DNA-binding HxlR family transcriptional regulator
MNETRECIKYIQPVRDVLDIINGKWKLPILIALSFGNKRFSQLEKEITGITPRMLLKELKELQENQLVERKVIEGYPVNIIYSLTEYGKSLDGVITSIRDFGLRHRKKLFNKT